MTEMPGSEKKLLLELAREAIRSELEGEDLSADDIPDSLKEKAGVFVTLTKRGELRGCVGMLEPVDTIADAVIRNARMAAFADSRFGPLMEGELGTIDIEISILSPLSALAVEDAVALVRRLDETKPGLVISSGAHRATFLPHVWEELTDAAAFLSNLSMKAGLPPMFWRDNFEEIEFQTYTVDSFSERDV